MWEWVKSKLHLTYEVLMAAGKEFGSDRASRMAAAVAYRTMFALAPMLLLAVTVFGLVLGSSDNARATLLARVEALVGTGIGDALEVFLDSVEVSGGTAAIVGVALLVWTASSLFIEIQTNLNDIFHAPQERVRGIIGFIRKRLLGFLWVLGVGIALIAVWLVNAIWRFFGDEVLPAGADELHFVVGLLTPLVSVILLPFLLALFFKTMSVVKVWWAAIWWGSFFTSVAFLAAAYGVGLYFSWGEDTSASQVAASLFVILLLAFVMAFVFFLGAEVTKVYDDYLRSGEVRPPSQSQDHPPEVVVSEPERALPKTALVAFVVGLLVGWRRRS